MNKAFIHRGTEHEISWDADKAVTPELVEKIRQAGNELSIDWRESQFYSVTELILSKFSRNELEERLYDEDPDLIETFALIMQSPLNDDLEEIQKMIRLYIPVLLILIDVISSEIA